MNAVLERIETLPKPDISAFMQFESPLHTTSSNANSNTKSSHGGTRRRRANRRRTIRNRN